MLPTRHILALLPLLYGASAHIRLVSPLPFGDGMDTDNPPHSKSPLKAGQFPCQMGASGNYDFSKANTIKAGDSALFKFAGNHDSKAVHGGGSCQFALAKKGADVVDPKSWKVIRTIIGGCPASAVGNVAKDCSAPESEETECLRSYNVQIPAETPDGEYIAGWTWFNKVGNREMYMQCSPFTVTGGGSNPDYLDTLPSIFYANVEGEFDCTTGFGGVLGIPNPGLNVQVSANPADAPVPVVLAPCNAWSNPKSAPNYPTKGDAAGDIPGAGQGSPAPAGPPAGNGGDDGQYHPPTSIQAPTTTATPEDDHDHNDSESVTATSYITVYITQPIIAAPGASSAASEPPDAAPTSGPESTPPAEPTPAITDGTCTEGHLPCSGEGELICVDANHFGLCDHGCLVSQPVADGTICENGAIKAAVARREAGDSWIKPVGHGHMKHLHHHME